MQSVGKASHSKEWKWNALLHAQDIIPEEIDVIHTDEHTGEAIQAELQQLLAQEEILQKIYDNYKKLFGKEDDPTRKSGNPDEHIHREIFKKKLLDSVIHNVDTREGKHTWWQVVNQLSDMTAEELKHPMGTEHELTVCDENLIYGMLKSSSE